MIGTFIMPEGHSRRPVLGISACTREFGETTAQVVVDRYVEAATRHADAAALLIPARPDLMRADELADRLDGLLLTGSPSNVSPTLYGDLEGEGPFDSGRDAMSQAMIKAMLDRGKPVFGICRGLQEINVACGGKLARDLGSADRRITHHSSETVALEPMFAHRHAVDLAPNGVLSRAFGRDQLTVNSVHFQGVATLGDGLKIEATAHDGVVEAFSGHVGASQLLAVQWHPEWRSDDDPFAIAFFRLLGRALRGELLRQDTGDTH